MNDTLTTLIAFVGFLIVFSMLVQSVQEGLKNLLKLKIGVWERFFVNLYQREFSLKKAPLLPKTSEAKAVSSSEQPKTKDSVGDFEKRMKRINDVICMADDLLKKMRTTLYEIKGIDPKAPDAKTQLLSKFGIFRGALEDVMGLKLDSLLNIYDQFKNTKISHFYNNKVLADFLNQYPDLLDKLKTFDLSAVTKLQEGCSQLLKEILDIKVVIGDYRLQIENKIDSWIAQVEEEYKRNMLKWTVIIGAAFVLVFNADTFSIYKYLGVDSKARTALIQKVAETTTKAQKANPDDLNAIERALKENKAEEAKKLIGDQLQKLEEDFGPYKAQDKMDQIKKLKDEAEKISIAEKDKALNLLKRKSGDLSRLYLELQKKSVDYQLEGLYAINLPLGWVADWKDFRSVAADGGQLFILIVRKIGGVTITIFLITFGAPFWNDILSALVGITRMTFKKG